MRRKLGQFMTPTKVASFMAALFLDLPKQVRLLDAGAGVGSLTAAFVHKACSRADPPKSIDVTAFEIDPKLVPHLEATLAACAAECSQKDIEFSSRIVQDDFILHSAEPLIATNARAESYNCAILNPPYAKLNTSSAWRHALRQLSIETSNLYAAFVAVALVQLAPAGQMVAITPRSFCNGSYFEPFRRFVLANAAIERVHVYESRRKAFEDDDVLQENIIYRLTNGSMQPPEVEISSSEGPSAEEIRIRRVPFAEVVRPNDRHCFIRLPTMDAHSALAQKIMSLGAVLRDLGLTVSTGRVVDFRAKNHLRKEPEPGTAPLIYPAHFEDGFVAWPNLESRKPNALVIDDYTADQVVPRGTYVLTKRFTSKEERRRIVAVIYDPGRLNADVVGFENHLNYFHKQGHGLDPLLARGLAIFLNSTAVDQFFRVFSGHTQVNATDLRNLHYPDADQLLALGKKMGDAMPDQETIDGMVAALI
ncbi:adenine-specific DNA-methyltransferase [Bradyrhizobium sp. LB14.3]|uniref:Eco57I restriction-modification methylase domain-containing protein n=1 Tax=Bradyrhizobium sp. LB14.3 TaxID=3156328 RepID=UPI003392874F